MEQSIVSMLDEKHSFDAELFYAHALRQSTELEGSTSFAWHQDTEEYRFIEYTSVVKLTPDR